jgi:choline dehydrogenase-like flavoprotein
MNRYDAIIVGAGAGGGVAAGVLAEAGKSVLLLERGRSLSFAEVGRDHLRNQRLSQYGNNAGPDPDGNPRVFVDGQGQRHVIRPWQGGYSNNAACVGSGTMVYGAQAWRFMPQDFQMASLYGTPPGSSLADWPISSADLEPFYESIEWEMGVSGDAQAAHQLPPGRRPYPMPPVTLPEQGQVLRQGADALGWPVQPVPLLINSVPYNGRAACIGCQHCVGFACPTDAKNGTRNTLIARALATGNCELMTEAMVARVETNAGGHVVGVSYFDRDGMAHTAKAEVVILAGGAVETARLLLNSATDQEPSGLGNNSGQVGRHLQGHVYPVVNGLFADPVWDGVGPGASTATCRFNHGNDGIIGGGMIADDFIVLPINYVKGMVPPEIPRWGLAHKHFMRDGYRRTIGIRGPVQEIPTPDARVTTDPDIRDRWGLPVARLSGTVHAETLRTADFMYDRAWEWLEASGAVRVWGHRPGPHLSGGQHQAGTCRMGDDPAASVADRWQRVHGHDNLFLCDGSVHVTNGGFNPVLTILALSYRASQNIVDHW